MPDMETKEKSIENKDEKLGDKLFVQQQIKKNKNKRIWFVWQLLQFLGFVRQGCLLGDWCWYSCWVYYNWYSGTGVLAGVGGSALITTSGVAIGAKVGSKAGSRRVGDVHTFEFKPLHNNKRTNLIVTVSGWMNGAMDDVRLPFQLLIL